MTSDEIRFVVFLLAIIVLGYVLKHIHEGKESPLMAPVEEVLQKPPYVLKQPVSFPEGES